MTTKGNFTMVSMPEDIHEKLSDFPQIIGDKTKLMTDLENKVEEARIAAANAKIMAGAMEGYKEKKFLGIKLKFGDTKENVKGTQRAVSALADAQKKAAEAQELSFKFQQELASTAEYLFYLGCYNIAANESMIANLNKQLRGEGVANVRLSEKVKEQFRNVVNRLMEQKDVLYRQQQMEEKSKRQEGKLHEMEQNLLKKSEEEKLRDNKLQELEKGLIQKNISDAEKDHKIEELISLLKKKDALDAYQSKTIENLSTELLVVQSRIDTLSGKLYKRTVLLLTLFVVAILLAVVNLII